LESDETALQKNRQSKTKAKQPAQTDVAANGDTTVTTYEWTLDVSAPMEDWVVNSPWKIVGGTGRFKNATGEGTGVTRFNAAGNAVGNWDGVIKY
jgi:hypothetical protein